MQRRGTMNCNFTWTFTCADIFMLHLLLTSVVRTPVGLEDVSRYPYLLAELARTQGWTMNQLEKLAGRNFLRVFRKVEKVN
jgi:microsomal dipeptidase-like Zn-dependent dipeptidase